jgi:hypothetical protein
MVEEKNLYGHPGCLGMDKRERRNLLSHFNSDSWTCKQKKHAWIHAYFTGNRTGFALMLIHLNDCDGTGEDKQIMTDIFNKISTIWSVKPTDSECMLGVSEDHLPTESLS